MNKILNIIAVAAVSLSLTGCGLYSKYESKASVPADVFGAEVITSDASLADMSWREFFTDPLLQQLIDSVLATSTDLNSARLAVEKSEASLKSARMGWLPSLVLAPQGTLSSFDGSPVTKTYNLPLQLSMDLDVFGAITSKKRMAQVVLMQSKLYEESVRANLVSTTAQQYYMLLVLDRQLEILMATDSLWKASLDTQKTLWEEGKAYSTAVNQMESSYLNVKTQIIDVRRNIRSVENAICGLLAITPRHIQRTNWTVSALPSHPEATMTNGQRMFDTRFLKVGAPASLLQLRPDVRLADFAMAEAYYNTQAARQAFFPNITLSGVAGWTNDAGVIVNPGKILLNALASLTQPLFMRGSLTANKKIAQLTEQDLQKKYVQTVIDAGNEVNEALADCQSAREKNELYHRQIEVLHEAYKGTHELMDNGKANYLEVLTAQESLLSAQLSEAMNMYEGAQAVIALYIALGGGVK